MKLRGVLLVDCIRVYPERRVLGSRWQTPPHPLTEPRRSRFRRALSGISACTNTYKNGTESGARPDLSGERAARTRSRHRLEAASSADRPGACGDAMFVSLSLLWYLIVGTIIELKWNANAVNRRILYNGVRIACPYMEYHQVSKTSLKFENIHMILLVQNILNQTLYS